MLGYITGLGASVTRDYTTSVHYFHKALWDTLSVLWHMHEKGTAIVNIQMPTSLVSALLREQEVN